MFVLQLIAINFQISEDRDKSTAEVSRITSQLNAAQAERAVWEVSFDRAFQI